MRTLLLLLTVAVISTAPLWAQGEVVIIDAPQNPALVMYGVQRSFWSPSGLSVTVKSEYDRVPVTVYSWTGKKWLPKVRDWCSFLTDRGAGQLLSLVGLPDDETMVGIVADVLYEGSGDEELDRDWRLYRFTRDRAELLDEHVMQAAMSADGRTVVYTRHAADQSGLYELMFRDLSADSSRYLNTSPSFTPGLYYPETGQILRQTNGRTVFLLSAETGDTILKLRDPIDAGNRGNRIQPTGDAGAVFGIGSFEVAPNTLLTGILRFHLDGSNRIDTVMTTIQAIKNRSVGQVLPNRDGTLIAIEGDTGPLYIVDTKDGSIILEYSRGTEIGGWSPNDGQFTIQSGLMVSADGEFTYRAGPINTEIRTLLDDDVFVPRVIAIRNGDLYVRGRLVERLERSGQVLSYDPSTGDASISASGWEHDGVAPLSYDETVLRIHQPNGATDPEEITELYAGSLSGLSYSRIGSYPNYYGPIRTFSASGTVVMLVNNRNLPWMRATFYEPGDDRVRNIHEFHGEDSVGAGSISPLFQISADGSVALFQAQWSEVVNGDTIEHRPAQLWLTETDEVIDVPQQYFPYCRNRFERYFAMTRFPLSPDGSYLVSRKGSDTLQVYDWRNKSVRYLESNAPGTISYFTFSKDGRYLIAISMPEGLVTRWSTETWEVAERFAVSTCGTLPYPARVDWDPATNTYWVTSGGQTGFLHRRSTSDLEEDVEMATPQDADVRHLIAVTSSFDLMVDRASTVHLYTSGGVLVSQRAATPGSIMSIPTDTLASGLYYVVVSDHHGTQRDVHYIVKQ